MNIINNTSLDLITIKKAICMINLYKIKIVHNGKYNYYFNVNNKKYVAFYDMEKYKIVVDYVKE
jgi:hypothetical protein